MNIWSFLILSGHWPYFLFWPATFPEDLITSKLLTSSDFRILFKLEAPRFQTGRQNLWAITNSCCLRTDKMSDEIIMLATQMLYNLAEFQVILISRILSNDKVWMGSTFVYSGISFTHQWFNHDSYLRGCILQNRENVRKQ